MATDQDTANATVGKEIMLEWSGTQNICYCMFVHTRDELGVQCS